MQNQELEKTAVTKCPTSIQQPAYTGVVEPAADADAVEGDAVAADDERVLEMQQTIASLQAQLDSSQAIPTCEAKVEEEIRDLFIDFYHWLGRCGTLFADMGSHAGKNVVAAVWPWPAPGFFSHSDVTTVASKARDAVSNITCEGTLSSLFNDGLGMTWEPKAACEVSKEHLEKAVSALPVDKLKSASDQAGRALSTPVEMARPVLAAYVEDFVQAHPQHAPTLQKDPVLIAVIFVAFMLITLWLLIKELRVVLWLAKAALRAVLQVMCCPCNLCCRRRNAATASTRSKASGKAGRGPAAAVMGGS